MSVTPLTNGVGTQARGREVSTEFGVTFFQLSVGVFGGVGALVAARRLEQAPDTVPVGEFALPIAIAGLSTIAGAMLLPTGE